MAKVVESKEVDYDPLCPHCEAEITEVHWRKISAWTFDEFVFICPNCKKVIGITGAR